jgi:hypothetical protein
MVGTGTVKNSYGSTTLIIRQNCKKNFDLYCSVTFLCFLSLKNDVNVPVFRIRIGIRRMRMRILVYSMVPYIMGPAVRLFKQF